MMRSSAGLTLIEVIVAIAICGIVLAALSTVTTSSLSESRHGNYKAQATQVLDTMGRRIAGGQDSSILLRSGNELTIAGADIDQLMGLSAFRDGAFEATISNAGAFTVGNTSLYRYQIVVCYEAGAEPRCVSAVTLGRQGGN